MNLNILKLLTLSNLGLGTNCLYLDHSFSEAPALCSLLVTDEAPFVAVVLTQCRCLREKHSEKSRRVWTWP